MSAGGAVEELRDLVVEQRPIGLERQEIVAATLDDLFGDIGLGPHGIDGDQRPRQLQPLEQSGMATISLDLSSTAS